MTESELYNMDEEQLRRLIITIEARMEHATGRMYDQLAIAVIGLPVIDSYIRSGIIRELDLHERRQIANVIAAKLLRPFYAMTSKATRQSWTIGEAISYAQLNKKIPEEILKSHFKRASTSHIHEFLNRKTNGLKLSDRVWRLGNGALAQIEAALQLGMLEGKSAVSIAQDLKQFLREPDRLYRRVRNDGGKLKLSKNAASYRPGQGVYRSSFKNARRLAATEINKTYRTAQWETWQQSDIVQGYEIKRSNRVFDCPVCESLKGRYPKSFKFSGWHPQCRCYMISVLPTEQEMLDSIGRKIKSKNEITDLPDNMKKWIEENKHRHKPGSRVDWIDENPALKKMIEK